MCTSRPKAPKPPPPPAAIPTLADESVTQAGERERINQRYARGRASTILTQGLSSNANTGSTLLGGAG